MGRGCIGDGVRGKFVGERRRGRKGVEGDVELREGSLIRCVERFGIEILGKDVEEIR